jgi:aminotransferase
MSKIRSAKRVSSFADSVFGEMTRLAKLHNAVNLSQGFSRLRGAAVDQGCRLHGDPGGAEPVCAAVRDEGVRDAIAADFSLRYGIEIVADEQVTVCCGSTEAMMASMLSCIDPGDEVIVFEPFYENYGPDAILAGAEPRYIRMREPDWRFDPDELTAAFSNRTRAIIINSPNNPTGKVFTRDELQLSPTSASAGMCSPSPTKSTSASCLPATPTSRWRRSREWPIARSRPAACPRLTA